jgi:ribonuclease BN (tRNA processing enzyme)
MRLQVVGCGDAFGSGGRNHACFLLEGESARLLLDCGPGSVPAMKRMEIAPGSLDAVFVSHLHGDHFAGIPFLFLEHRYLEQRATPLQVVGPPGLEQQMEALADALYSSGICSSQGIPVEYPEMPDGTPVEIAGARVSSFPVRHAPEMQCRGVRVEMDGRTVVYTGDTEWFDGLVAASRGADLMLLECTYHQEQGGYHLRLADILRHRDELECRQLLLVHLGAQVLAEKERHDLPWAHDGMILEL